MNDYLIERLARDRLRTFHRRAEADASLRDAGHPFVRLPAPALRAFIERVRRGRTSATPAPCCA